MIGKHMKLYFLCAPLSSLFSLPLETTQSESRAPQIGTSITTGEREKKTNFPKQVQSLDEVTKDKFQTSPLMKV